VNLLSGSTWAPCLVPTPGEVERSCECGSHVNSYPRGRQPATRRSPACGGRRGQRTLPGRAGRQRSAARQGLRYPARAGYRRLPFSAGIPERSRADRSLRKPTANGRFELFGLDYVGHEPRVARCGRGADDRCAVVEPGGAGVGVHGDRAGQQVAPRAPGVRPGQLDRLRRPIRQTVTDHHVGAVHHDSALGVDRRGGQREGECDPIGGGRSDPPRRDLRLAMNPCRTLSHSPSSPPLGSRTCQPHRKCRHQVSTSSGRSVGGSSAVSAEASATALPRRRPGGERFSDLQGNPTYIAAVFSTSLNGVTDRDVMTINVFDWMHRTGANPPNEPTGDLRTRPSGPTQRRLVVSTPAANNSVGCEDRVNVTGDHLSFDGDCGVRPSSSTGRRRTIRRCTALPFLCVPSLPT